MGGGGARRKAGPPRRNRTCCSDAAAIRHLVTVPDLTHARTEIIEVGGPVTLRTSDAGHRALRSAAQPGGGVACTPKTPPI